MRPSAFLAALLSAAFLAADAPIRQITPPAGQSQAVLQAPVSRGTWVVVADEDLAAVAPQLVADGSLAILQAKPGRYHVRWRQGPLKAWQATTIDLGGVVPPGPQPPTPPVPPVDPPLPDVTPAPEIWITVLREEQDTEVPQQRVIEAGIAWAKARKHHFRTIDDDVTDVDGKPSTEVATLKRYLGDTPLPAVVICNADGTHLGHFALPATAEKFTAELGKYGK